MACSQLSSSVRGILQARILEWIAVPFSGGSSQLRDLTWVSCIAGRFLTVWATRAALKAKVVVVQWPSRAQLFANPWTPWQHARPPCPSSSPRVFPSSRPLHWWCHPAITSSDTLFSSSIFPSIRVFSNESVVRIRWPKCWSFSFSISPSNEYSGLISLKIDWFGLLSVQGTLRSLLQHHSSKASILQCFFLLYGPALTTICDQWEKPKPWQDRLPSAE